MKLKNKILSTICSLLFPAVFIILAVALVIGALRVTWNDDSLSVPAETLSDFTYEITGGGSGTAAFPHNFQNLPPHTAVTIYVDIKSQGYNSLLVKTVYTKLRLYADDTLIYECGEGEGYPRWLPDPPTLLKTVSLPENTSQLRFEYISPSQRSVMSLPVLAAGSDGALFAWIFGKNGALFVLSLFFMFLGLAVIVISLLFRHKDAVFLYLGLFAFATGCWSFGECDATAFLLPYPVLLYLMAFGGLFTLAIPLLRYGQIILNPQNPVPMRLAKITLEVAVIIAFVLQFMGQVAFSKSMYMFHLIIPLALAVFAGTAALEYFRYRSKMAKRFALPTLVLAIAAILEVVNYRLHFTNALSLFFLLGTLLFTLLLGVIGAQYILETHQKLEKLAEKTDFYRQMSHNLRTPLTIVSTNIQTARRRPEEADELLTKSQAEIMKMAEMIDDALKDGGKGEELR